jgi:stage V sporulation protein K
MESFIRANPGMESRIPFRLAFDDYSPSDLMKIIRKQCSERNRQFDSEALAYLSSLFMTNRTKIGQLGNGRWARNVLEAAIRKQSRRLIRNRHNSQEALRLLTLPDVRAWEEENS